MKDEILPLGVMTNVYQGPLVSLERVRNLGLHTCQLENPPDEYVCGEKSDDLTWELKDAIKKTGVKISSVFILYKGRHVWDLIDGPGTYGWFLKRPGQPALFMPVRCQTGQKKPA